MLSVDGCQIVDTQTDRQPQTDRQTDKKFVTDSYS